MATKSAGTNGESGKDDLARVMDEVATRTPRAKGVGQLKALIREKKAASAEAAAAVADEGRLGSLLAKAEAVGKPIELPDLDIRTAQIQIVGDAPLICHAWDEKAKKQMLDKQMMVASKGKEAKDPEACFRASLYKMPGGKFGFKAIAFKSAAVTACTSLGKSISKVAARQAFHVVGELIEIKGEPTMREDMVRIGMGKTADIRYRGEFKEWSCNLLVRYNARVLSDEQIVNLLNIAGFAVGVGEWRPERDGQYGLFHVVGIGRQG